jgi:hypothetical protein
MKSSVQATLANIRSTVLAHLNKAAAFALGGLRSSPTFYAAEKEFSQQYHAARSNGTDRGGSVDC